MANSFEKRSRPLEPVQRAIVIGASSGIGAALVEALSGQGYQVAAVARREPQLTALCEGINQAAGMPGHAAAYVHDVTEFERVPELFQQIVRDLGGLDLIAYVAGLQHAIGADEFNFEKDAAMVETNLLGAIAWINQAAARFQRAGSGQIIGISSIAGDRGRIASPVYNSSKAGLNSYLEAVRNRLARHGVTVTTIKPGFVDTVLLAHAPKTFWVISPAEAARQILKAAQKKRQVAYVPARWGLVGMIIRHIPSFIFRRLSI